MEIIKFHIKSILCSPLVLILERLKYDSAVVIFNFVDEMLLAQRGGDL